MSLLAGFRTASPRFSAGASAVVFTTLSTFSCTAAGALRVDGDTACRESPSTTAAAFWVSVPPRRLIGTRLRSNSRLTSPATSTSSSAALTRCRSIDTGDSRKKSAPWAIFSRRHSSIVERSLLARSNAGTVMDVLLNSKAVLGWYAPDIEIDPSYCCFGRQYYHRRCGKAARRGVG